MGVYFANAAVQAVQHTLCLAQGISHYYRIFSFFPVLPPPLVYFCIYLIRSGKFIYRQPKSTFRNKAMAPYRLKGYSDTIKLQLIITTHSPHLSFIFKPYLCRTPYMPCRVQGYFPAIHHYFLIICYALHIYILSQSEPEYGY